MGRRDGCIAGVGWLAKCDKWTPHAQHVWTAFFCSLFGSVAWPITQQSVVHAVIFSYQIIDKRVVCFSFRLFIEFMIMHWHGRTVELTTTLTLAVHQTSPFPIFFRYSQTSSEIFNHGGQTFPQRNLWLPIQQSLRFCYVWPSAGRIISRIFDE